MMDFTQDERNMMMLYSPGTRSGLCEALTLMKEQLSEDESELFALADSVLRKVSAMGTRQSQLYERLERLVHKIYRTSCNGFVFGQYCLLY